MKIYLSIVANFILPTLVCRTCIVKFLAKNHSCPKCEVQIHKNKPLMNIHSDETLQDIVYKVVPNLFRSKFQVVAKMFRLINDSCFSGEMNRRKEFYKKNPQAVKGTGEDGGELDTHRIYSQDDIIPLSIEYLPEVISYSYVPLNPNAPSTRSKTEVIEKPSSSEKYRQKRYLKCLAGVRVWHIKKLLRQKYELKYHHDIEVFYKYDLLADEYSMVDLAYIYSWRRNGPIALYYKISDLRKCLKRKQESEHVVTSNENSKTDLNESPSPVQSIKKKKKMGNILRHSPVVELPIPQISNGKGIEIFTPEKIAKAVLPTQERKRPSMLSVTCQTSPSKNPNPKKLVSENKSEILHQSHPNAPVESSDSLKLHSKSGSSRNKSCSIKYQIPTNTPLAQTHPTFSNSTYKVSAKANGGLPLNLSSFGGLPPHLSHLGKMSEIVDSLRNSKANPPTPKNVKPEASTKFTMSQTAERRSKPSNAKHIDKSTKKPNEHIDKSVSMSTKKQTPTPSPSLSVDDNQSSNFHKYVAKKSIEKKHAVFATIADRLSPSTVTSTDSGKPLRKILPKPGAADTHSPIMMSISESQPTFDVVTVGAVPENLHYHRVVSFNPENHSKYGLAPKASESITEMSNASSSRRSPTVPITQTSFPQNSFMNGANHKNDKPEIMTKLRILSDRERLLTNLGPLPSTNDKPSPRPKRPSGLSETSNSKPTVNKPSIESKSANQTKKDRLQPKPRVSGSSLPQSLDLLRMNKNASSIITDSLSGSSRNRITTSPSTLATSSHLYRISAVPNRSSSPHSSPRGMSKIGVGLSVASKSISPKQNGMKPEDLTTKSTALQSDKSTKKESPTPPTLLSANACQRPLPVPKPEDQELQNLCKYLVSIACANVRD